MCADQETYQCEYICVHEGIVQNVKDAMPSEDALFDLSELFKLFGDSTRIKILYCLFASEMCVCDLAYLLNMTKSAISHQLRTLKAANLVKFRKDGKVVYYSLADDHVNIILKQSLSHITE